MTTPLTLGPVLRQARERANLSQEDLADQLGVSVRTVADWERPNHPWPWPRHRAALARFIGEHSGVTA